jgi:hypothetical protein
MLLSSLALIMKIIQGAIEYEDVNIVLRTEERRRRGERDLTTPWETIPKWDGR